MGEAAVRGAVAVSPGGVHLRRRQRERPGLGVDRHRVGADVEALAWERPLAALAGGEREEGGKREEGRAEAGGARHRGSPSAP